MGFQFAVITVIPFKWVLQIERERERWELTGSHAGPMKYFGNLRHEATKLAFSDSEVQEVLDEDVRQLQADQT